MKRTCRSTASTVRIPSLDTLAALVHRNPAIPQKATKRTKAQSLGNARALLWTKQSLLSDQSQNEWITTSARRVLCLLRFLLLTTESLRIRTTGLLAVAMSLASFTQLF